MLPSPEDIKALLESTLRRGARAHELNTKHQELRDLLCPAVADPQISELQRARKAEEILRAEIDAIGGERAAFLRTVLHFVAGGPERLTDRYRLAGELFGVSGRAARTSTYKDAFLNELALNLHALLNR